MDAANIIEGLNPEQLEVVTYHQGALCVGAVAGAGKTNALCKRIAYLIKVHGVDPRTILAVTFSRRAAQEMNERLHAMGIKDCRVGTWHSLALQIARNEIPEVYARDSGWKLDTSDRYRVILKEVTGYKGMKWDRADVTVIGQFVTRCKARAAAPGSEAALEIAQKMSVTNPRSAIPALLNEAFSRAEIERKDRMLYTFDDMLVDCARVLEDELVAAKWGSRWDFVMQDEAQDENLVQFRIGHALAKKHGNYMLVGDPAQAIYGFRGANPDGLLSFADEWNAKTVLMHRNYRSGSAILEAANGVLAGMDPATKLDMTLTAERKDGPGEVIGAMATDSESEAADIVHDIQERHEDGAKWGDHVVLYRTNAQSRCVEEALLGERIPYVVVGGSSFYERREVKVLLSYLRIADGRGDFDDVKRSLNAPFRYLGRQTLEAVRDAWDCSADDITWPDAVRVAMQRSRVWAKQRASAETFAALIESLTMAIEKAAGVSLDDPGADATIDAAKPARLLQDIVSETGFVAWLRRDEGTESSENDRVSNVRELIRASERFRTVTELLDYIDDVLRRQKRAAREGVKGDVVTLMSIHRSKGLEWPTVYLTGAIDGMLPHAKAEDEGEEMRLFYVAVTRARDTFRVSCPVTATFNGRVSNCSPSRYVAAAGIAMAEAETQSAPRADTPLAAE